MSHMRLSRPRGFTLIELLVVVAIIALLIAILLPSLTKARKTAQIIKCQGIAKQLSTAHHMYANQNEDYFVPHSTNGTGLPWYRNVMYRQFLALRPANNFPEGMMCPSIPPDGRSLLPRYNLGGNGDAAAVGSTDQSRVVTEVGPFNQGDYAAGTQTGTGNLRRHFRAKVMIASEKLQNIDGSDWNLSQGRSDWKANWDLFPETDGGADPNWGAAAGGSHNTASYRHLEGANISFFDGHAEHRPKEMVFQYNAAGTANGTANQRLWRIYRKN